MSTAAGESTAAERRLGATNLRSRTAGGVLVNSAYQAALVGITALKGLVVAGLLTRADYGVWGLLGLALWTALGLKSQFGANDKYVQQQETDQELAFQRGFTVEVIFAVATAPLVVGVVVAFAVITGRDSVLAPGFALLALLPAFVLQFPLWTFYRDMDYRRQRILQSVDPVLGTVVTIVLAVLGAGYWSFVVGLLTGAWATAAMSVRASPYRFALKYEAGTLASYLRFSGPLLFAAVATLAVFQVIFLVGAGALGIAGLGAFTLVGNLVQFTDQADTVITETMYPAVCAVRDQLDLLSEAFIKSNRLALIWAVPFGVGLAVFAGDLVHFVIGRQWDSAIPLLRIMGLVTAVHHIGFNWYAFFKARGSTWQLALVAGVNALVIIGVGVPLMYSDGLIGLGMAFAIAEATGLALRAWLIADLFKNLGVLTQMVRAFAPVIPGVLAVLAIRALAGVERGLIPGLLLLVLYLVLTGAATVVSERTLLREAVGYLLTRRQAVA